MPHKSVFRAGILALLTGLFLYWVVLVWIDSEHTCPQCFGQLAGLLLWFSGSLAGGGGLLLVRVAFRLLVPRPEFDRFRIFPGMMLQNVLPVPRYRPIPLLTEMPNFGLIYGAVLWILIFLFIIVEQRRSYHGLPIDLSTHELLLWHKSPWAETLSVYLGVGEKYYINGEPVSREALRARLQQELSRRAVWTVYFEADYDTLNMNAIYAMDVIQSLGAKLVWITPKVRQQLTQNHSHEVNSVAKAR